MVPAVELCRVRGSPGDGFHPTGNRCGGERRSGSPPAAHRGNRRSDRHHQPARQAGQILAHRLDLRKCSDSGSPVIVAGWFAWCCLRPTMLAPGATPDGHTVRWSHCRERHAQLTVCAQSSTTATTSDRSRSQPSACRGSGRWALPHSPPAVRCDSIAVVTVQRPGCRPKRELTPNWRAIT